MSEQKFTVTINITEVTPEMCHREMPNGDLGCFSRRKVKYRDGMVEYSEWELLSTISGPWHEYAKAEKMEVKRIPVSARFYNLLMGKW